MERPAIPQNVLFLLAGKAAFFASGGSGGEEFFGVVVGNGLRVGVFRDLGVLFAVGDVGAEAAVDDSYAVAKIGDVFLGLGLQFRLIEGFRLCQRNLVRIVRFDTDEEFTDLYIRAKAADIGPDVLPVVSLADQAW